MATSISSYIPALVFSYELDEIAFFTDLPRLTIRVSWYGETLFQTSLYAFEFKASFFNANEIVEMLMKEKNAALVTREELLQLPIPSAMKAAFEAAIGLLEQR